MYGRRFADRRFRLVNKRRFAAGVSLAVLLSLGLVVIVTGLCMKSGQASSQVAVH